MKQKENEYGHIREAKSYSHAKTDTIIRGRERCSRVYPVKVLGNSSKLYSGMMSTSQLQLHCAVATVTVRIRVQMETYK